MSEASLVGLYALAGRVRWTKASEVYMGAGTDKAVFEALPKQFVNPSIPTRPQQLFEAQLVPRSF